MFVVLPLSMHAQQFDDIQGKDIDIFLSKEIMGIRDMSGLKLINSIGITDKQGLIVAAQNQLLRIGYYAYQIRKIQGKTIETFCVIGSDIYYVSKSTLYKIDSNNVETKVMPLPFSLKSIWAGQELFYAAKSIGKESRLYAFSPEQKKSKSIFSTEHKICSVDELGAIVCVLTENSLVLINTEKKQYIETPIDTNSIGTPMSLAVDKRKGAFYISTAQGIYRIYKKSLEKISNETGILYFDTDGLIVFRAELSSVIRLRNSLLYPPEKGVLIEIKD